MYNFEAQVKMGMKRGAFAITGIYLLIACSGNSPEEIIDCSLSNLTVEVTKVKFEDCGLKNGEITVAATGGTEPYTYSLNDTPPQTSPIFEDLKTGFFDITIEDFHGCSVMTHTLVGSKETLIGLVEITPSGCDGDNGTITTIANHGTEPYKYQLGENSQYQDSPFFEGLLSGEYSVWIGDANDCLIGVYLYVPSGVSYSEKISPIISSTCSTLDCHGGTQAPDFRIFDNVRNNAAKIKELTQSGVMPKIGSLTAEEINLIACWVDDGAPGN